MKAVVSLSGGMDSTTVLQHVIDSGVEPHVVLFQYGSKHNAYERSAVSKILDFYGLQGRAHVVDLTSPFSIVKSNLLKTGGDIPEGHYNDATMSQTVVPGRNLTFIAILAAFAESIQADFIALGVHQGDHHIYPDCRPVFIDAAGEAVRLSTEGKVHIRAPFLSCDKAGILAYGTRHGVPYQYTRTCYKDQPVSCGKCGSCQERLEAWKIIGVLDPIPYACHV